ncbi:YppF family protein [Bacillus salitolerans]|uniref:YppF family protein n=1 Tax=Bacillus salitolerans TaxID=1437434 RepID=A0ABW4LUN2_9BACI
MKLVELRNKFIALKQQEPIETIELLQFAKVCYIRNDISIVEYREIVKELEVKADYTLEGQL